MTGDELPRSTVDPDGRTVAFTAAARDHIVGQRPQLADDLAAILVAVAEPDLREPDPLPGRERFYRRHVTDKVRWLRVVVDFTTGPGRVVTAFVQRKDPRP